MTIQNLYFFNEIVKDLNLSQTAIRLSTSQQALSGQIKRLEDEFGVRLFHRSPKLSLTKEGEFFQKEALVILNAQNRLITEFGKGAGPKFGSIKIACSISETKRYLPKVISKFSAANPEISVAVKELDKHRIKKYFDEEETDMLILPTKSGAEGMKIKRLYASRATMLISKDLLAMHYHGDVDLFIKRAVSEGIHFEEMPKTIPLLITNPAHAEHWMTKDIPVIKKFPMLRISLGGYDAPLEICKQSSAMMIISRLYCDYINAITPIERQNDLLFFPVLRHGKPFLVDEYLIYDNRVSHPQYFYDFIDLLMNTLKELNIN